jgi:predicted kinase
VLEDDGVAVREQGSTTSHRTEVTVHDLTRDGRRHRRRVGTVLQSHDVHLVTVALERRAERCSERGQATDARRVRADDPDTCRDCVSR